SDLAPRAQGTHAGELAFIHDHTHVADQTGIQAITRQVETRPEVDLQIQRHAQRHTYFLFLAGPHDDDVAVDSGDTAQHVQVEPARIRGHLTRDGNIGQFGLKPDTARHLRI